MIFSLFRKFEFESKIHCIIKNQNFYSNLLTTRNSIKNSLHLLDFFDKLEGFENVSCFFSAYVCCFYSFATTTFFFSIAFTRYLSINARCRARMGSKSTRIGFLCLAICLLYMGATVAVSIFYSMVYLILTGG